MFSLVNLIASTWFLSLFIPATASPSGTPASTTSTAANLRLSGRQVATGTSQSYNGTSDLLVTTTVSGSTFILTFVPTTAPAPILKTEPTTTITTTSEAPIWAVPILPIGWPGPPPVPPLDKPVPLPDLSAPLPDLSVPLPDLSVPLPDLPVPAPDHPVPSPDNPTPTGDEDDSTKCTSAAIPHCTEVCSFIYSISDHTVQTSTDCPSSSKICSTVTTCQPASTVADETKTATADRALETGDEATDVIDYLPGDWPANPEDGTHAQAPLNSDYAKLGIPPYTKCDGEKTDAIGVETNFFLALASVFCKSDLSKASVVELTNKDIPSRKRWIGARTPPPTTGGWAGYKFHFEWIPGAANCLGDCQAVFEDIAFQCKGFDEHTLIKAGNHVLDLDCGGEYKWSITVPDKPDTTPPLSVSSSTLPPSTTTTLPSADTTFDPSKITLSCGARYGSASVVPMAVPRGQTDYILKSITDFCSLSDTGDDMLTLEQGKSAHKTYWIEKPSTGAFQLAVTWDPRPECSGIPAPTIRKATPAGPDYWCNTYLGRITNGCDTQAGQDKNGGTLETNCVIYAWEAFDASTGGGTSPLKRVSELLAR